jgi:hypothetical protein
MIDITALRKALEPIGTRNVPEVSFDFNGTLIVLMPLRPAEEVAVQKWAAAAVMDDDEGTTTSGVEYLDPFKFGCLGFSVTRVGSMDLRHVEHVETGEILPNGTAVKVTKDHAVRDIIAGWPRPVLDALFKKFTEMMERYELEADKMVSYDPVDKEAEIARLEEKIGRLRNSAPTNPVSEAVAEVATAKEAVDAVKSAVESAVKSAEPLTESSDPVGAERSPVIPSSAQPVQRETPVESETVDFAAPFVEESEDPEEKEASKSVNPGFIDKDDESALGEEAARISEIRKRAGMKTAKAAAQASRVGRVVAPHHAARETASETGGDVKDGIPVFRPPTQEISGREATHAEEASHSSSTENPKFRPPGR